ncbi:MAG: AAA family ATPase [Oligoflexia bacterium]|nr:AAA family ATPase [Oligoflexia bacterium]
MKMLPIGVQTFEDMIKGDFVYVDKTKYFYELLRPYTAKYFLSRPRRFGVKRSEKCHATFGTSGVYCSGSQVWRGTFSLLFPYRNRNRNRNGNGKTL